MMIHDVEEYDDTQLILLMARAMRDRSSEKLQSTQLKRHSEWRRSRGIDRFIRV